MIAIIRIKGQVEIPGDIKETLNRFNLKRKYSCTIIKETPETRGMLKKIRSFVAFGNIDEKTFKQLIEKRGQHIEKGKKLNPEKIISEFVNSKTNKKLSDFEIKPVFRLHPPRGGIKSKFHYPKGVLGNNKQDINKLITRML